MSDFRIFDIAGSAMAAQSTRLNTVASNLANADSLSGDPTKVYKPRMPVFQTVEVGGPGQAAVGIAGIVESETAPEKRYEPGHPLADAQGYVYAPSVNPVEEMVNMISAARSYQSSVEVLSTSKDLMLRTINLGK
ncbi:MAG: flagellar basal body rod protein FlgC [Gammaproteobacteria bacterium]|nr:flagellar basal body rod protein FlgC [Gammaproteobacteria bacterium]